MVSHNNALITLACWRPRIRTAESKTFYPTIRCGENRAGPVNRSRSARWTTLRFLLNSLVAAREENSCGMGAQGVYANTLGEVPDGAWYTNRQRECRMTIEELKRGPGNTTPPSPAGPWRVISAKSDGVTPGFIIEDERKNRYVLKFDPPDFPELASAADVIGSKAFYALGYNTPENYIVHFRLENIDIPRGVMYRAADGKKRPLTARVLEDMLKPQPKGPDGKYRAMASRFISGKLAGPFSYGGMRPTTQRHHSPRRPA